jgi:hypothetical protein
VTGEMERETRNDAPTQEASAAGSSNLGATLLRVAWLAILLGMAMEGILLLLSAGFRDLLEISRVVHKGAIQALAISGSAGDDLSPFLDPGAQPPRHSLGVAYFG